MAALVVTVSRDLETDVTVLRLGGLLSLRTAWMVSSALTKTMAECPQAVIVDVTECHTDGPGRLALFPAALRAQRAGPPATIMVCGAHPAFLRGGHAVLGAVRCYDELGSAMAALEVDRSRQRRVWLRSAPSPRLVVEARHAVSQACREWNLEGMASAAMLVITELVANAIRHGHGDVGAEAMMRRDFLHLRVSDASAVPPVMHAVPAPDAQHGRGLLLVHHYASAWGVVIDPPIGKVVWATMRIR